MGPLEVVFADLPVVVKLLPIKGIILDTRSQEWSSNYTEKPWLGIPSTLWSHGEQPDKETSATSTTAFLKNNKHVMLLLVQRIYKNSNISMCDFL